jgi:hypothetical protein
MIYNIYTNSLKAVIMKSISKLAIFIAVGFLSFAIFGCGGGSV